LASSSSGNAAFVGTEQTRLLIDAGLSRREIAKRLAAIDEDLSGLTAVLITHEHSDHTNGVTGLAKATRNRLPFYASYGTAESIDWGESSPPLETFQAGRSFSIGNISISTFTVPHDAADPVGFTLAAGGIKVAIATDLGYIPDSLRIHLRGVDFLVLESNHDIEMLRVGPYPWPVKQRVMSRRGHLSNEMAARFLENDLDTSVSTVVLGHISEHNNHPELVRHAGLKALKERRLFTNLVVAEPGVQSEVFCY
jgi:phosphoribosyl 1,2-cyclic phosphodiesterase